MLVYLMWSYRRRLLHLLHVTWLVVTALTCRLTEQSLEYVGDQTKTEFMSDCLRAQDMIPSIFTTYDEKKHWFEDRCNFRVSLKHAHWKAICTSIGCLKNTAVLLSYGCVRNFTRATPIHTDPAVDFVIFRYVNDDYDIDLYACRSYPAQYTFGINEHGPVCYVNDTETGLPVEETCSIHFCRSQFHVAAYLLYCCYLMNLLKMVFSL